MQQTRRGEQQTRQATARSEELRKAHQKVPGAVQCPETSALWIGPFEKPALSERRTPLVEIGWIQRARGEAVRGIMTGEEIVASPLLVMLRLRADIEYLAAQRNVRWRCIIRSIKLLRKPPEDQCGQARIRYGQVDRMASVPSPSRKRQLLPPWHTSFRTSDPSTPPQATNDPNLHPSRGCRQLEKLTPIYAVAPHERHLETPQTNDG